MDLPMSSDQIAVRADRLCKTYGIYDRPLDRLLQLFASKGQTYGRKFEALADISFTVPTGKVLGLVGRNGAGKSTLLQVLCKTLQPTSGALEVNGRIAALLELGSGFNPEFTGRENVYLNASVLGLKKEEIDQRFDEIVEFSGLKDFIDQPVKTYSSGMYVRLAFSIATSVEPDILVIDEALSVGDGAFARKSFDRIMDLKSRGATILFCSHSMYHIEAICDQAIWLEKGRMVMLDSPEKVARAYSESLLGNTRDAGAEEDKALLSVHAPESIVPSGEARLTKVAVSVDGVTGKFLKARAAHSELKVYVEFKIAADLPPPTVVFALETLGGQLVTSTSTFFDGVEVSVDANSCGTARLCYPSLPLMRGSYRVSVFLACEKVIHVYDHAAYCVEIEVEDTGLEQGLVFLPHVWNDSGHVITRGGRR
ncbi:ABC transporter ATP-binding protein [Zoogloea sp.]|uniref:ABC transporter ATP-binding protein n=1 Tax=Zoogloea sp. TaxID=49181 RepID=UPI0025D457BB|nr:ABC transporter ATP-binding protein [Zoogloea sp.]